MATTKPLFKSAYQHNHEKGLSPVGLPEKETWEYKVNEYGQRKLVVTGKTNVYDMIQAALEETKIENVLKRAAAGDDSMLNAVGEVYADISEMPRNLIEARQQMQNLENLWGSVPNEIKAKYNFNVEEFIGASGSDGWLRDMGLLEKVESSSIVAPEVKEVGEVTADE